MEKNSALQELNQTQGIYSKYILNSKLVPILFSAANVNIFIYVFWTIIYYTLYYGYTVSKINKNIKTFNENLAQNESVGITVKRNRTLVESYQKILPRVVPFILYVIVVIVLQYVINVFIMRDKCDSDSFISFRTVNIYTIGVWFVILFFAFGFLYKVPKLKSVYSNSVVHKLFNKFVEPSKEKIFASLFKKYEDIANPQLKELVKDINCNFMKKTTKEEKGEEYDAYCKDKKSVLFLNNINISNYSEYFKLMEPIINKNGNENEFLKYIIKKDILSEMLWVIKIGIIAIAFIYTKLKNTKCLNHKKTYEENVKEYIDSKMKQCAVEEDDANNDTNIDTNNDANNDTNNDANIDTNNDANIDANNDAN